MPQAVVPEATEDTIFAILFKGREIVSLHFFELPRLGSGGGMSHDCRSYLAFCRRERKAFAKAIQTARTKGKSPFTSSRPQFVRTGWFDVDAAFITELKMNLYEKVPSLVHQNLKEFYEAIRYDIRRKRFLREGEDFKSAIIS